MTPEQLALLRDDEREAYERAVSVEGSTLVAGLGDQLARDARVMVGRLAEALQALAAVTEDLAGMVNRHADTRSDGSLYSLHDSTTADAMRTLARLGRMRLVEDRGNHVVAEWVRP